jgi:hypothetical protein
MKDAERWEPLGVALWFIVVIVGFCFLAGRPYP